MYTTNAHNPWLSAPPVPPPPPRTAPERPKVSVPALGPTRPQRGAGIPLPAVTLGVREHTDAAALWWLGVHGGAGESSLASLYPRWRAAEHRWPLHSDQSPSRVVLVCRSHAGGLRAAQHAATQWATGSLATVEVLGLVVMADAPGRLPRPLRELAHVVSGGLPRTWMIPWIESWRLTETPLPDESPRAVRRLVDDLHAILKPGAVGTVNRKETS